MTSSPNGILLVDKPEGPTSHDMVRAARRALGTRRVGHTGTLDPFASGLLVLCIGWATRLAEYIVGLDKSYRAVARLGEVTDTADRTGTTLEVSERWRELSEAEVEAALLSQVGEVDQVPPAYSAKKIAGVRAYEMARRGEEVALAPVRVSIDRIEVLEISLPDVVFEVDCSSGTYIRSIARDLGEALGTGAHLTELRRTRIGHFYVTDAVPASRLDDPEAVREGWVSPLAAVAHLPRVEVGVEEARALGHGARVATTEPIPPDEPLAITRGETLLAIGEGVDGLLRARKVFPGD